MKNAVRHILLGSVEAINPSPNSLFPPAPQWGQFSAASMSADGVLFEDGAADVHAVLRFSPAFLLKTFMQPH